jgi:hypothetical protein
VFYGSLCVAKQSRQEANSGLSSYMYFIHAVILEGSIVGYFTNRIGRIPTKAAKKRGKGTTSHVCYRARWQWEKPCDEMLPDVLQTIL